MNLHEYLNQKQVNRLIPGTVELKQDEIIHHGEFIVNKALGIKANAIEIKQFKYTYRVDSYADGRLVDNGVLYTIDEQGNKNSPSVFKITSLK